MTDSRDIRSITSSSALGAAVLGVVLFAAPAGAWGAEVTNPADNPAPITITIDGQKYTDGLDTLPGYDDQACTPIPNVEYDFPSNRILYYDGQGELQETVKWTEWARISSYQTWVAQQKAPSVPAPAAQAPASPATPSPSAPAPSAASPSAPAQAPTSAAAPTPTAASPGAANPSAPTSNTPKPTGSQAAKPNTSKPGGSAERGGQAAPAAAAPGSVPGAGGAAAGAGAAPGATTPAAPKGGAVPGTTPEEVEEGTVQPALAIAGPPAPAGVATTATAVTPQEAAGPGDTRLAGVGILGILSLAGLGLLSGNFLRRHTLG